IHERLVGSGYPGARHGPRCRPTARAAGWHWKKQGMTTGVQANERWPRSFGPWPEGAGMAMAEWAARSSGSSG
ncbi:hypothetical protein B7939_11765, partial [Eggerthia catenaformis]